MGVSAFPRQARLLKPAEFKSVFDSPPLRFSAGEILLLAKPRDATSAPRLGVVAPKKACRLATGRNRFKRQVRESYRLRQDALAGLDIVILARNGIADLDNTGIRQRLDTLWTRLLKRAPSVLASHLPSESSSG
jgi:ribonuclease P protein component